MTQYVAFWTGGPLSAFERLSLQSFTRRDHVTHLYTYEFELEAPPGVQVQDARDVLPLDGLAQSLIERKAFALLSNVVRYRLLASGPTGLTWVDTDVVLLADDLPNAETICAYESPGRVNGAVLRSPPNSALTERLIEAVDGLDADEALARPWGTYGPRLITQLVSELSLEKAVLPQRSIYPIHFKQTWRIFDPESTAWCHAATADAAAIHLWNEVIRRSGFRSHRPPEGSFLMQLCVDHGVEVTGPTMSKRELRRWAAKIDPAPPSTLRAFSGKVGQHAKKVRSRLFS